MVGDAPGPPRGVTPQTRRRIAIGLGWFKTAAALLLALLVLTASGQDPAGRGMAAGLAAAVVLYWAFVVLPALRLAYKGRRIGLSLALLLVPDALVLLATQLF